MVKNVSFAIENDLLNDIIVQQMKICQLS